MNIYDYFDYRKYIKDYYEMKKKDHAYFSFRFMGQKLQIDPGYLVKVMQGKYHLSQKTIPLVAALFKLSEKESAYFETLVHFGKAKSNEETKIFFEKLLSFKDVRVKRLESYQFEFYQRWYYSAIRSLLGFYDFTGDFNELANLLSPPISVKEAKNAINLLEKTGLIEQQSDGKYNLKNTMITSGEDWKSIAIRQFQKETILLAAESIDRHDKSIRDISTVTIAVSQNDIEEIKAMAKEFRASILKFAEDCTEPQRVYQLNIQFIPLTEVTKGKA